MKGFLITLGASLLKDIANFFKSSIGKISIAVGAFYIGINLIPYSLSLDNEIYTVLTNKTMKTFFYNLSFMLPLDFVFKCIMISILSKYFSNFWHLIQRIFSYILNYILKEKTYYEN